MQEVVSVFVLILTVIGSLIGNNSTSHKAQVNGASAVEVVLPSPTSNPTQPARPIESKPPKQETRIRYFSYCKLDYIEVKENELITKTSPFNGKPFQTTEEDWNCYLKNHQPSPETNNTNLDKEKLNQALNEVKNSIANQCRDNANNKLLACGKSCNGQNNEFHKACDAAYLHGGVSQDSDLYQKCNDERRAKYNECNDQCMLEFNTSYNICSK